MAIGIPLYKKRLLDRGYNQAALLAGAVSREFNIPDCSAVIKRVKNTKSQRSLARYERYRNMVDAFCLVDADIIMGKTILIVDDVYTTGNTAGECARLPKENGAQRVYAAAAASGRRY